MEEKFVSTRNLNFLLFQVFEADKLAQNSFFSEYDKDTADLLLGTAHKLAADIMRPCLREMDINTPEYRDGEVYVHPSVRIFMQKCGETGLISAPFPFEEGGQQLPRTLMTAVNYIFAAANYSLSVYPGLTSGAASLLISFGSEELKKFFLPPMFAGKWQGTMALTEPEAGSSLADITTKAKLTDEGYYLMEGKKIFISAGSHDGAENAVHLMLARVEGAPAGVKGISLFAVPKLRGNSTGELAKNDITCGGIEHKLGYRGAPITQLYMGENGDCRGWLVGEENMGLSYMFQMMNEERINVGVGAAGIASAAYYDSLKYATERNQGRPLSEKDPASPQCAIINHPDIKRMLLLQKALSEASLSLALQVSQYTDMAAICSREEKEDYELLIDFLTPIVKTFPSETGITSTSAGLQILGGYGYCRDFNLELFFRDARIHPIHEGTTGIQGQDLLGRKSTMKKGRALELFLREIDKTAQEAVKTEELAPYGEKLEKQSMLFRQTAKHLISLAEKEGPEVFLSDASIYLELAGLTAASWQWLKQGLAALQNRGSSGIPGLEEFYELKIHTMKYFFKYEFPKSEALAAILRSEERLTTGIDEDFFID